ncbi:reverse transcriptase domain-containing protein [Streptomyces inhibens]|uniref:reverse transcriptase domain-containing protein n=1 Tax=Streptomyces inhibens TaxID=2293571 RepID=UPI001FD5C968|nr:reverse transcriptase domain-containing protein [Streptomyces inhibens]
MKAFLKSGILSQDGQTQETYTGTPQGGILSPLLANVALSVLDEHVAGMAGGPKSDQRERAKRRRHGLANYRLIRYADDFLVLVSGNREQAEAVRAEVASVLAPMGLTLSAEKTLITHIDDGFDFLGWRIQRHIKRGTDKRYVYTYPARKALDAVKAKVKKICRKSKNLPLTVLLHQLNSVLRGWCAYFRPGVSKATFQYLGHFT